MGEELQDLKNDTVISPLSFPSTSNVLDMELKNPEFIDKMTGQKNWQGCRTQQSHQPKGSSQIYRIFHGTIAEHTPFSSTHRAYRKITTSWARKQISENLKQ